MEIQEDNEIEKHYNNNSDQIIKPTRDRITQLGELLIDTTDDVIKEQRRFISSFNRTFDHIYIKTFIFDNRDYKMVIMREVDEITDILKTFDIRDTIK